MLGTLYSPEIGRHDSALIHHHLFHQNVAEALHNAAVDLALVPHRIENRRHIMDVSNLRRWICPVATST